MARSARLCGVDQLHVGTGVGKMAGGSDEVVRGAPAPSRPRPRNRATGWTGQEWEGVRPAMPIASGGLHPGHMPALLKPLRHRRHPAVRRRDPRPPRGHRRGRPRGAAGRGRGPRRRPAPRVRHAGPGARGGPQPVEGAAMKVFLITPEAQLRTEFNQGLPLGWTLEAANTAEDALKMIEASKPDLVIADLALPGMSGISLLQLLAKRMDPPPASVLVTPPAVDETTQSAALGAQGAGDPAQARGRGVGPAHLRPLPPGGRAPQHVPPRVPRDGVLGHDQPPARPHRERAQDHPRLRRGVPLGHPPPALQRPVPQRPPGRGLQSAPQGGGRPPGPGRRRGAPRALAPALRPQTAHGAEHPGEHPAPPELPGPHRGGHHPRGSHPPGHPLRRGAPHRPRARERPRAPARPRPQGPALPGHDSGGPAHPAPPGLHPERVRPAHARDRAPQDGQHPRAAGPLEPLPPPPARPPRVATHPWRSPSASRGS